MKLLNYPSFRLRSATLMTCFCLVVGCATLPVTRGPCIPVVPANYSAPLQHAGNPRVGVARHEQRDCCPRFLLFSDPVLNVLVKRAEQQNLSLCESYQRIVEARAWARVTRGGLFPTANTTAEYARTKRSSNARPFVGNNGVPFDLFSLGFDSSWEIDLFGKLRREVEVSETEIVVQQENFQDVRLTLVADVASNYIRVRVLQNQLQIAQQNHQTQKESLVLVEQLQKAGKATALDVAQARSLSYSTLTQVPELEQQIQLALNQLCILLGEAPGPEIRTLIGYGPIPAPPEITGLGLPAELVRRRPDIRRSEQEVLAASGRIGVAAAELYPQLSLLGTISVDSRKVSSLFTTGSLAFSAGPSFRWNILNFWRVTNSIKAYEAQFCQAVTRYRSAVLNAVREVEDGLTKYDWERLRVTLLEQTLLADEQAVELSLSRYKSGKASYQRVLDSQEQLLRNKQALATSRGILALELIRISKAVGGGWCGVAWSTNQPSLQMASPKRVTKPTKKSNSKSANPDAKKANLFSPPPTKDETSSLPIPAVDKSPQEKAKPSSSTEESGTLWRLPSLDEGHQSALSNQPPRSHPVAAKTAPKTRLEFTSNVPYALHVARGWPLRRKLAVGFFVLLIVGLSLLLLSILRRRQLADLAPAEAVDSGSCQPITVN